MFPIKVNMVCGLFSKNFIYIVINYFEYVAYSFYPILSVFSLIFFLSQRFTYLVSSSVIRFVFY